MRGITAYMRGDNTAALAAFKESMAADQSNRHVAEEYFAGFSLIGLERLDEAAGMLRRVLASDIELPDKLMTKYGIGGGALIGITEMVTAQIPNSHLAAALMLAEVLQHTGQTQEAIEALESLGSIAPSPLFALSLADLYSEFERWDDVIRVTDEFRANEDDATCEMLVFRARALRERGLNDGALEVLKEALKSKKREEGILAGARYERALVYESQGQKAKARREWERVYAVDASFRDVAARVKGPETP